ncbi:MAG: NAD(P)-dependent oxidoreductase [Candidatus Nanohalobium sp.]
MKIGWFDAQDWEKEYVAGKNLDFEVEFFEESLTPENSEKASEFDVLTVFVDSEVDETVLKDFNGKMVATRSTGYDHIDTDYAEENSIAVTNVPEYGDNTVAEHTFGLILTLSRKIYSAIEKVEDGEFNHEGLRGRDLAGKKLGVIGTGSIGQKVIKMANGFDMEVIASDPYPDREAAEELGYMYVSKDDLLEKADIITLHCPLTDSTRHMLSSGDFKKMEDTIVVNTARGTLIDTDALIKALDSGSVDCAGLDVLEDESFVRDDVKYLSEPDSSEAETVLEDHILIQRDDVLITPHNAFNSEEAMQRIVDTTLENIRRGRNIVNRPGRKN